MVKGLASSVTEKDDGDRDMPRVAGADWTERPSVRFMGLGMSSLMACWVFGDALNDMDRGTLEFRKRRCEA